MTIKHTFVSPVQDLGDPNEVGPDEWNQDHKIGDGTLQINAATNVATFTIGSLAALTLGANTGTNFDSATNHVLDLGNNDAGGLVIQNSSAGAGGPELNFYANSASPAAADQLFGVFTYGNDTLGINYYGGMQWLIVDPTHATLSSKATFSIKSGGGSISALTLGTTGLSSHYSHIFDFGAVSAPHLLIKNSDAGAVGPNYVLYHNSASPAVNDTIGQVVFDANNNGVFWGEMASISVSLTDITAGAPSNKTEFWITNSGTEYAALTLGTTALGAPSHVFTLPSVDATQLVVQSSNAGATGPIIVTYANSASPAANDIAGIVQFVGNSSTLAARSYGLMQCQITSPTNTVETSNLSFQVKSGGANLTALTLGTTFNGQNAHMFDGGTTNYPRLVMKGTSTGVSFGAPELTTYNVDATPTIGDDIGWFGAWGRNSSASTLQYGRVGWRIGSPTAAAEGSNFNVEVLTGGASLTALTLGTTTDIGVYGHKLDLGGSGRGAIEILSSDPGANGPIIATFHNSASPAALDELSGWYTYGKNSGAGTVLYSQTITGIADATAASEDAYMQFKVISAGSLINALTLDGNTYAKFGQSFGYATGTGGAVTQLTNRTTGVTLNKQCGGITLVSAAGSATWNTFTVTNSVVAATDTIILSQQSGANTYNCIVTGVAAGSFKISVSAVVGTATESPIINFAVLKAVAA